MHAGQLHVDAGTVRELVERQFPSWSGVPVTPVPAASTVNALFRIGEDLAARFPLQPADVDATRSWLRGEAAAAGELLGATSFATPEPVAIGEPDLGYPLPWRR